MNVYAPIILCFVPFITMFLLFAILVPGISIFNEFRASLAGLVAFIPIVLLQFFIPELRLFRQVKVVSILLYSLIFCGLIEEGVKSTSLLILKAKGETLRNFFLYSLLAGMILGCFESIVYLLQLLQNYNRFGELLPPAKLIHLRMGTSLVIHTLCAGLGGLCVFYRKNIQRNFAPLIFAIVIHGVYDFFAAFGAPLNYFSIAVILLAALECRIIYVRAREELNSKNKIEPKGEEEMFFSKKHNDEIEDFDAIQKEAEAALKKSEEKKSVSKTKTQTSEKTVATKTAAKKTVAKSATKKETAKTTTKKASAKNTSKTVAVSKTAPKKTDSAKKVVSKSKATSKAAGGSKTAKTTTTKNASKKSATRKK